MSDAEDGELNDDGGGSDETPPGDADDHHHHHHEGDRTAFKNLPKSIVIMELPEMLADRSLLQSHFSQFGNVNKMSCSVKHHYAVVMFETHVSSFAIM
jgi:hypothetical protein